MIYVYKMLILNGFSVVFGRVNFYFICSIFFYFMKTNLYFKIWHICVWRDDLSKIMKICQILMWVIMMNIENENHWKLQSHSWILENFLVNINIVGFKIGQFLYNKCHTLTIIYMWTSTWNWISFCTLFFLYRIAVTMLVM